MNNCVSKNSADFKSLYKEVFGIDNVDAGLEQILAAKISVWQDENGIANWPLASDMRAQMTGQATMAYIKEKTGLESLKMSQGESVGNEIKEGVPEQFESWVTNNQSNVQYQLPQGRGIEEFVASEKTIRDLAARMSDRIGIPVRYISDRSQQFKGKLENGTAVINLAYAALDTPIHEILGHPIIRAIKNNESSTLYQNLLKELEYGKGEEVLDRIKRDYNSKQPLIDYSDIREQTSGELKGKFVIYDNGSYLGKENTLESAKQYVDEINEKRKYTLEEQQEEAIVELLGLMTAEKLNAIKDGKLISLLKRLLKEMKQFVRSLINQKEVEIDKLPDNMRLGDIADLLAYSNSKLILPGNEVVYTTPDNQQFKTYAEASNHISELAKSVKDVDLSDVKLDLKLSEEDLQKIEELENQKKEKE